MGAAKHVRETLAKSGTWMIVEPFAADSPEKNHNPVGRVFYSASTMLCVPHSLSQGGPALGAQAGEARLREVVVKGGGFGSLRRATEMPFNIVLEARPCRACRRDAEARGHLPTRRRRRPRLPRPWRRASR